MRERNRTTDSVRFKGQVITVVEKCKLLDLVCMRMEELSNCKIQRE